MESYDNFRENLSSLRIITEGESKVDGESSRLIVSAKTEAFDPEAASGQRLATTDHVGIADDTCTV